MYLEMKYRSHHVKKPTKRAMIINFELMEHTAEIGSSLSLQLADQSIAGNVKKSINGSEMWEVKM